MSDDPFTKAKALKEEKERADLSKLNEDNRRISELLQSLNRVRGQLKAHSVSFLEGCSKSNEDERCILIYLEPPERNIANAISFRHGNYWADGTWTDREWDEESKSMRRHYFDQKLGPTVETATVAIAGAALEGKLPAYGSVMERGMYTVPTPKNAPVAKPKQVVEASSGCLSVVIAAGVFLGGFLDILR